MSLNPNRFAALTAVGAWLGGCHQPCELDTVTQGTRFKATVVAPSTECPEIVPVMAGDVLTFQAGRVADNGNCRGNVSSGLPPEFPLHPASPYRVDQCEEQLGIGAFDCQVTAPSCTTGNIKSPGSLRGGLTLSRYPKAGEVLSSELWVLVGVGADLSCSSDCSTKILVTVERY